MARLDIERQKRLEPKRMTKAIKEISALGYKVTQVTETELTFIYSHGRVVHFFPYSGWHAGSGIKDGRGLKKLLKQIR